MPDEAPGPQPPGAPPSHLPGSPCAGLPASPVPAFPPCHTDAPSFSPARCTEPPLFGGLALPETENTHNWVTSAELRKAWPVSHSGHEAVALRGCHCHLRTDC